MFDIVCGLRVRAKNLWDCNIVRGVAVENRYCLPAQFASDDVILDVGAHIGSFSHACLIRGAGKVLAFDPDGDNIRLCAANLRRFKGRAIIHRTAIWRSDTFDSQVYYTGPTKTLMGLNFGGGNVVFEDGKNVPVKCESLDSVLSNIRRVRLLKLDCESSEWPILLTCKLLECVEVIVGEFHEIGGKHDSATIPPKAALPGHGCYVVQSLVSFLSRHGFSIRVVENGNSNIGLFFAERIAS